MAGMQLTFLDRSLSEKYMFMGLLKADHHWGDRLFLFSDHYSRLVALPSPL
jgi:hypothetical protein